LGEQVFDLVKQKIVRGASIGFNPIDAVRRERADGDTSPSGFIVKVWDLLEWSFVSVPMNPGCTVLTQEYTEQVAALLSRGIAAGRPLSPMLVKSLQPFAAPLAGFVQSGFDTKRVEVGDNPDDPRTRDSLDEPIDADEVEKSEQLRLIDHYKSCLKKSLAHHEETRELSRKLFDHLFRPEDKRQKCKHVSEEMKEEWRAHHQRGIEMIDHITDHLPEDDPLEPQPPSTEPDHDSEEEVIRERVMRRQANKQAVAMHKTINEVHEALSAQLAPIAAQVGKLQDDLLSVTGKAG
jgi:hypothetical protein